MSTRVAAIAVLLVSCAGSDPPPRETALVERSGDAVNATRADREREVAPATPRAQPGSLEMQIAVLEAGEAEDASGARVQAARPIAIDLDAHRFMPRALDPVLVVGQHRFHHYRHPRPGVLRFVVADASLLDEGALVAVEYEGDPSSRVVISESLTLEPGVRP